MCGIWASLGLSPSDEVIEAVAHRGPDGKGWREFSTPAGLLVLAHRRLAVFDTSDAGLQPMQYGDGRYWLVFNGAIYNFHELRDQLISSGHTFNSQSDSEVLLAAFVEWGEDCLDLLNGMFAFVIWDRRDEKLFAARDRFGIKPLYYLEHDGGVAFASEIKQFQALDGWNPRLNAGTAYDFLVYGQVDHNSETFFSGVCRVGGGECVSLDAKCRQTGGKISLRRWYSRPEPGTLRLGAKEATTQIKELLEDSVRLRMRSDVKLGSCLSGGLDSSSIICLADNLGTNDPLVTVSACYDDPNIDERKFMDVVNAQANTEPVATFPDGTKLEATVEKLVLHMDEPFTSTSMFAQWCVFRSAQQAGATVMLDGQGADEQFCGYHSAFSPFLSGLVRGFQWRRLLGEMTAQRRRHGTTLLSHGPALLVAMMPRFVLALIRRMRRTHRPDWLANEFTRRQSSPLPFFTSLNVQIRSHMFESSLPMLLRFEDRNSMAHGIESRLPFLDHRLVELGVGLGDAFKIVDGETKWILRRAMSGILPPSILIRQDKIGFATPEFTWLSGPASKFVFEAIEKAIERFPDVFNANATRRLRDDMLEGKIPYDSTI